MKVKDLRIYCNKYKLPHLINENVDLIDFILENHNKEIEFIVYNDDGLITEIKIKE